MPTVTSLDKPTSLYRVFGAEDCLLYVGIAGNPGRRFEQHAKDKPWWSEVVRMALDHFPDRTSALLAEAEAIRSESPKYNHTHNQGRAVPLPAGVPMPDEDLPPRDRLTAAVDRPLCSDSLVGSFFHSYVPDDQTGRPKIRWQGCVVGEPAPGIYLIETFSWVMGESFDQQVVRVEDMVGWSFFDSADWMNNAYRARGAVA